MSFFSNFMSTMTQMATKTPAIQSVRFRYHAEKAANRHFRRFGYKDSLDRRGLLPHYDDGKPIRALPAQKYY